MVVAENADFAKYAEIKTAKVRNRFIRIIVLSPYRLRFMRAIGHLSQCVKERIGTIFLFGQQKTDPQMDCSSDKFC